MPNNSGNRQVIKRQRPLQAMVTRPTWKESSNMFLRLATQIREQLNSLVDQYDARLRIVPGYANLPPAARRELAQGMLQLIADCLEVSDDSRLMQYIRERAEQVLAHGFQPEWFQQAVTIPQDMITPLVETVAESNFVWRALGRAQLVAGDIAAQERRQIELTLRESEARYQSIFDTTPIMFWLKDTHNRTLRINRAAAELEGVKPAEVEGKSAYDLYPREQAEAFYQDDLAVIRSNQPKLGIVEQHTSVGTGKSLWLETGKIPVHNDRDETIGVLAFAVDVTERKQAEDLQQRSALQQQRISLQLRSALEAASELIQIPDLDAVYRRSVELAREKFDIERCGLYMLDESRDYLWGTYGTDDQRRTTDERGSQRTAEEFAPILTSSPQQLWIVRETPHIYVEEGVQHVVGAGWVVGTVLRGAAGPIGILFNDSALSGRAIDEAQQEALAIYCSIIGSIIERKRLEEQIQESLARRGAQVQTSTEVAQEIASAPDLNELFKRVVTLIKERFNYYHAQLFRYEPSRDAVVLITGYGEIGQKMLAAGHELHMGRGVVGTAAATGQSILAADVRQDADWQPNPHLPQTRGELAVPVKWRDQVLGILDVQSDQPNALTDEDRLLLEGLCGQIASAMESTRLFEELRRNEAQLSEALKIARLAYWEYDVENDLFLFNDQFYSIFRTTAEQAGGYQLSSAQYAQQFVHPDDLPIVGAEIEKALSSTDRHYSRVLEHRILYADGSAGYISVSVNIDRNEQGHIIRYYGANQDITQLKLAEQEFARFKQGLEQASDAVFMTDVDGYIVYVNPAFEKIYGYTRDEALGQTPRILKSGQLSQEFYQGFWQALLNKQSVSGEKPNKTKDGRVIIVEDSNSPILDSSGNLLGFLSTHRDITDRKQAEQALERSARLLHTIINTSRDLIYVKDTESRFLVASQATANLMGAASADDLIGKNDYDFFPYELAHKYYTDEQKIIQAGEPLIDIEEPSVYPDGTKIWLSTTKVPYRSPDGKLEGLLGIGRDITERKRSEQRMEETLRETERLYAAVSHENWQAYRQASKKLGAGYLFDRALIQPADNVWEPEIAQALEQQSPVTARSEQRAVTITPLSVRGAAIGALGVYDDPAHPLSADDLQLIDAVSEQVALALESARLFDQTQRDAEREHTLNRIATAISRSSSVNELLPTALDVTLEVIGYDCGLATLFDTATNTLTIIAQRNLPEGLAKRLEDGLGGTLCEYVFIQGRGTFLEDMRQDAPLDVSGLLAQGLLSYVGIPMIYQDRILGTLCMFSHAPRSLGEKMDVLLQSIGQQIGVGVTNARLFEQTQQAAEREHTINRVTSRIRNARSVDEVLSIAAQELRLATRASRSMVEISPVADQLVNAGDGEGVKA
jgi:PAS domain S-box-containing protein